LALRLQEFAIKLTFKIASFFVLLVISTIYGFLSLSAEMGLAILAGSIGLAFSNIDKISKFKGAGFEAEMNMVHTLLENQTEPTIEQKEEAKTKDKLTHDENCILICLQKSGYTWRYISTISSETGISNAETTDYLHSLMSKGFAKNGKGSKGEIWSITSVGKSVQEQHQFTTHHKKIKQRC
jgi:predicted transcriptional regulator